MPLPDWVTEFPGGVTVCDTSGVIVYMNAKAGRTFARSGGTDLVGQDLFACHPEPARTKLRELLTTHRTNAYTIEKGGLHKLIYQAPWFENDQFMGLVELSLEIPADMPHFIRQPQP